MSTFDREAVIEGLKRVLDPWVVTHHNGCHGDDDWGSSLSVKEGGELAEAALPVAVKAVTDELRALAAQWEVDARELVKEDLRDWASCTLMDRRSLLDRLGEIDAAAGVTR